MSSHRPTIGILTGGGDCPGLNAVIRAATKSAERLGYEMIGFLRGYEGLVDPVSYMPLDSRVTADILLKGGTILGSSNKGRFSAIVGEGKRVQIDPALLDRAAETIRQLGVVGLICVGGDGSLAIAQQLYEHGIPVVGVPKTIDNDLSATDYTFGFDTAVTVATEAIDRLHTTAESHHRILICEVMGRHAGWIALHSGMAGGANVILIPEVPFDLDQVIGWVESRFRSHYAPIICVAEGALPEDGDLITKDASLDAFGHVKLSGIGEWLAGQIEERTGKEARTTVLGHVQRGGSPTAFDRVLATRFGLNAIEAVKDEAWGTMVALQGTDIVRVPLQEATGTLKTVPIERYEEAMAFFG